MNIYTGGTFDLFHAGHVNFLEGCRRIAGDKGSVVVSLNTDEFIAEYKGKPPVISYRDREAVVSACKYVDRVIPNNYGANSKATIEEYRRIYGYDSIDCIVVGDDWAKKDYYQQMGFTQKWLDGQGILLCYIPYTQGISSTEIKERLK